MPFTIITLKKVPPSLRGDLSKWMQEIATGVYVGNFNTKIREQLWNRVVDSSRTGEVTLSYACQNEIGYDFETINAQRLAVKYDGIPLVALPKANQIVEKDGYKGGYSNAAKYRKAKKYSTKSTKREINSDYIVIDIETDGLDYKKHKIIEIGAVKVEDAKISYFHKLIAYENKLPTEIIKLTGISHEILEAYGVPIDKVLQEFVDFIEGFHLVGYSVDFDLRFLNKALNELNMRPFTNKVFDLKKFVKREKMHLKNFKLETVLQAFEINEKVPHRALKDAKLIYQLSTKVNKFLKMLDKE